MYVDTPVNTCFFIIGNYTCTRWILNPRPQPPLCSDKGEEVPFELIGVPVNTCSDSQWKEPSLHSLQTTKNEILHCIALRFVVIGMAYMNWGL